MTNFWAPCGPVNMTHKINYHTSQQLFEVGAVILAFLLRKPSIEKLSTSPMSYQISLRVGFKHRQSDSRAHTLNIGIYLPLSQQL